MSTLVTMEPVGSGSQYAASSGTGQRTTSGNSFLSRAKRNRRVVAGGIVLIAIAALALIGPSILHLQPFHQNLRATVLPPRRSGHLLGTDQLGRDILARTVYGARISLMIGIAAVLLAGGLGVLVGLLAGYHRGAVDAVLMRAADAQLAIPDVLLVIALISVVGPSLPILIGVLGVSGWIIYARIVRSAVLSMRERTFVEAVRALGGQDSRILFRHVLPNVWAPVIVVASQQVGKMILLESTLSFLGAGVQPPTPSWGGMIADGRNYLMTGWWVTAIPGLALLVTVIAVNLLGDGLQDAINVRLRI